MTKLPAAFRRITLELGREASHPQGDRGDRYQVIAPVRGDERLDAALVQSHREACRVSYESDGNTRAGHLIHGPGGRFWFRFEDGGEDELVFRLADEQLRQGEYISVVRHDGDHAYRLTSISVI